MKTIVAVWIGGDAKSRWCKPRTSPASIPSIGAGCAAAPHAALLPTLCLLTQMDADAKTILTLKPGGFVDEPRGERFRITDLDGSRYQQDNQKNHSQYDDRQTTSIPLN
jgi:hypothetical protein